MHFAPALPPLAITILALLGALSVLVSVFRRGSPLARSRRFAVIGLRAIVITALIVILANPVRREEVETRNRPGAVAVLTDTSASMSLGTPSRSSLLPAWEGPLRQQSATPVRFYQFSRRAVAELIDPAADAAKTDEKEEAPPPVLGNGETRLGQAMLDVLEAESAELRDLVILSDGRAHDADAISRALTICRNRNIRVSTAAIGSMQPLTNLVIQRCDAPVSAISRSKVPVTLSIQALLPPRVTELALPITITDASGKICAETTARILPGRTLVNLEVPLEAKSESFTVKIAPQPDEISIDDNSYTFTIAVSDPRLRILYMEGSNHTTYSPVGKLHEGQFLPLAWLQEGDIDVDLLVNDEQLENGGNLYKVKGFDRNGNAILDKNSGFPTSRADLFAYDIVICSDINRGIFTEQQLQWVLDLVTEEGGGFVMIGGDTAFDTGGWDKTIWEKLVPVDMREYGRGHRRGSVVPRFPDSVLQHPILQFTGNEEIDRAILTIHPPFLGSHLIERAKSGATVLAATYTGEPLIAVQQYGKGRAMAFLSDAAGGWGDRYQLSWGPRYLPWDIRQKAEKLGLAISDPPDSIQAKIGNRYYNRFWVNTVRWLGENARGRNLSPLRVDLSKTAAAAGESLTVSATLVADRQDMPGELSGSFADGSMPFILKPAARADQFSADIVLPAELTGAEHKIKVTTKIADREIGTEAPLRIEQYNLEFSAPAPDPGTLERIASITNGIFMHSPGDLEAVLKGVDPGRLAAVSVTIPAWDRAWLWTLVILAFSLAWLIPKLP